MSPTGRGQFWNIPAEAVKVWAEMFEQMLDDAEKSGRR